MSPVPDTEIDLDVLTSAIVASIAAAFPTLQTVRAYDPDPGEFPLPALFVAIEDMEGVPDDDRGTGQLPLLVRFEAVLVVGFKAPSALRAAPKLAAAIARHIYQQRWGQPAGPAEVTVVEPDEFLPILDRFVTWRIEWQQIVHIGESVWRDDGTLPSQVLASWAPDIGPANESKYSEITGELP